MAKFSGGTLNKDGVLSYVYEAKPGGRKNNVNIKNVNGEWFFVNKDGEVRDKLANKGKLSKTHIDNLKGAPGSSEENIFASANVSPETGKVATQGDLSGSMQQQNTLENSNYSLAPTNVGPGMNVSTNTQGYTQAPVAPTRTNTGSSFSDMASGNAASVSPTSDGTFTTSNFGGGRQEMVGSNTQAVVAPNQAAPIVRTSPNSTWTGMADASPMTVAPDNNNVITPSSNTGFGETPVGNNTFNTPSNYSTNLPPFSASMPESTSGWSDMSNAGPQGVEIQSQGSTTPGVTNIKKDNPWGAADWEAVGSVMKVVGGLASAYTGIKNYQLARDAYGTQKDQWQKDYNQRLQAYEDNKALANEEIAAKNRVLKARGQAESYKTLA